MIIPTAEFDPMFANDGVPFRDKMIEYIIREFSDSLGANVSQIHQRESGPAAITAFYSPSATETPHQSRAA